MRLASASTGLSRKFPSTLTSSRAPTITLLSWPFLLPLPVLAAWWLGATAAADAAYAIDHPNTERCRDRFDEHLRQQCGTGQWQQRFYYDTSSAGDGGEPECRMFWWDECRSESGSRNFFVDRLECQWLCAEKTRYKSKHCIEPFDPRYRESCQGGRWEKRYFFDKDSKRCAPFWFDGCISTGQNFFADELSCADSCEELPTAPSNSITQLVSSVPQWAAARIHPQRGQPKRISSGKNANDKSGKSENQQKKQSKQKSATPSAVANGNRASVCEREHPCQNNATCVVSKNNDAGYYCECAPGFTNDNCTELVDFDPCANAPCLNGGTCSAKATKSKTTFECQCPQHYAGERCELKPCEAVPCKNNGTCRTTKAGPPWYFCECPPQWGGKNCVIEIPAGEKPKNYAGSSAEQLSSGKVEWINEIREQLNSSSAEENNSTSGETDEAPDRLRNIVSEEKPRTLPRPGGGGGNPSRRAGKKTMPGNMARIVGEESPTRTLTDKGNKGASEETNGSTAILKDGHLVGHIIASAITILYTAHAYSHL